MIEQIIHSIASIDFWSFAKGAAATGAVWGLKKWWTLKTKDVDEALSACKTLDELVGEWYGGIQGVVKESLADGRGDLGKLHTGLHYFMHGCKYQKELGRLTGPLSLASLSRTLPQVADAFCEAAWDTKMKLDSPDAPKDRRLVQLYCNDCLKELEGALEECHRNIDVVIKQLTNKKRTLRKVSPDIG
jgi:hypothetical protein